MATHKQQEEPLISNLIPTPKSKTQKYLRFGILKGRAMVGLDNTELEAGQSLQVHVQYEHARYSTKRVMSQMEPVFNEFVEFDLPVRYYMDLVDMLL